jgi:hypothetical protein
VVDGKPRRFGVSGKLWHGVLVMFDRETDSYWTQVDGRAIQGDEIGKRLDHVPSVFTTFEAWVDAHPDTLVLEKTGGPTDESSYANYFADPDRLFLSHLDRGLGDVVPPKTVVFGVRHEKQALAVTEARLERERVVRMEVGGASIALLRHSGTGEVRAVLAGDRVLEPVSAKGGAEPTEKLRDANTGETVSVAKLPSVRVDRAFWYAWKRTVPGARVLAD